MTTPFTLNGSDRINCTIANTPGTSGSLTISTAVSNYLPFTINQDGGTFDVFINDPTIPQWEIRTGCVYTYSGFTLSRGTLVQSSTGSACSLSSSSTVAVVLTGERLQSIINTIPVDAIAVSFAGAA